MLSPWTDKSAYMIYCFDLVYAKCEPTKKEETEEEEENN